MVRSRCDKPLYAARCAVRPERRRIMSSDEEQLFGIDKLNIVRSQIPAATHVDYSARVQTVEASANPRFHALLSAFEARTGCPVVVNTSSMLCEPIVCTPEDAYRCFMRTEMDFLAIGNFLLDKRRQPEW